MDIGSDEGRWGLPLVGAPVPRAASWRSVPGLWRELSRREETTVIVVSGGQVAWNSQHDSPRLVTVSADRVRATFGEEGAVPLLFLGVSGDERSAAVTPGTSASDLPRIPAYFALVVDEPGLLDVAVPGVADVGSEAAREFTADLAGSGGAEFAPLRAIGDGLGDLVTSLAVTAVALAQWHAVANWCSICGGPTVVTDAGWVRTCESCARQHYPRTDPAMIVTVLDGDDRLLLGHAAGWPALRYSLLAGFIEAGEAGESAVRREVFEETGIEVTDVEYVASQPWPFPASLMFAYRARACQTDIHVDGVEITDAAWFTRAELAAAVADGTVQLPVQSSIARALIDRWWRGGADD